MYKNVFVACISIVYKRKKWKQSKFLLIELKHGLFKELEWLSFLVCTNTCWAICYANAILGTLLHHRKYTKRSLGLAEFVF